MTHLPTTRAERKKEDTRARIITASVTLFNRHGLHNVTMEQIAEEVDIAKGTLYNHFPSKDAIISAFLQRTFQQRNPDRLALLEQLPDTRARMVYAFHLLIDGVQAQKEIFEAFMVYRMKQVISFEPPAGEGSGLSQLVRAIIRLGQQSGDLRADLPSELLEGLFEYAFIAAVRPLYTAPAAYNPREAIERSVDLFLTGAAARSEAA